MFNLANYDQHLVTIYNDTDKGTLNSLISSISPEKDTRILIPEDEVILLQAAQNSSVILIYLKNQDDRALRMAKSLKDNRSITADIIAVVEDTEDLNPYKIMAKGFDLCIPLSECEDPAFKAIFQQKVTQGSRRLAGFILEEEYRRFSDALSCAPTSVIVFDPEKRIVFVSEHYFRAYPKSAHRLIRGLNVYDAFDMMSAEENVVEGTELYENIREFWYSLSGDIEFTLASGISYRLKAVALPNQRGTIVTAQNITEYVEQRKELKKALSALKDR